MITGRPTAEPSSRRSCTLLDALASSPGRGGVSGSISSASTASSPTAEDRAQRRKEAVYLELLTACASPRGLEDAETMVDNGQTGL